MRDCDWMLIGLEAVLVEGLLLVADVIFPLRLTGDDVGLVVEVDVGEEVGPTGGSLLPLSLTLFELPNQRLRRVEDVFEGERFLVSSSAAAPEVLDEFFSFSNACVRVEVDSAVSSAVGISTSSASRYHFLRRVYRSHPSWPRRPSFHCRIVSSRFSKNSRVCTHFVVIVYPPPTI